MLQSVLNNPQCVVICGSESNRKRLVNQYKEMYAKRYKWYHQLIWKIFGNYPKGPVFLVDGSIPLAGRGRPIIYDNYVWQE